MLLTDTFVLITCYSCQAAFGMSDGHYRRRKEDHKTFWCPACGTSQVFTGKTEKEKLEERIRDREASIEYWRREAEQQTRSKSALRGQMTKLKKRIHHGVCPHCQRTFKQLQRHMEHKHPEEVHASRD